MKKTIKKIAIVLVVILALTGIDLLVRSYKYPISTIISESGKGYLISLNDPGASELVDIRMEASKRRFRFKKFRASYDYIFGDFTVDGTEKHHFQHSFRGDAFNGGDLIDMKYATEKSPEYINYNLSNQKMIFGMYLSEDGVYQEDKEGVVPTLLVYPAKDHEEAVAYCKEQASKSPEFQEWLQEAGWDENMQ